MDKIVEARERLKKAICVIASELDIDPGLTRACIQTLTKDELIDKYIELKDLRLKKENMRLVDLLIS
ncbi:hypothetical protein I5677_12205 [Mobilitalea sibirica]|uniref:Uncharacterized protein n=2 Tax=Mobilitalea sibirica TaxID=1462919 RepID=A0A8J7H8U4_9FIRM|nr:hypothetical protein [Mobilitalea sibirica]